MVDKMKIESVQNALRFIMGVLNILLEQSNVSPQARDYYINKMWDCIQILDNLDCMGKTKEGE